MSKGIFTISLDFELHWGGFEKWPLDQYRTYFNNTRRAIPYMLQLFEDYGIHVTWATVGMLFHHSKNDLLANAPLIRPHYEIAELSAYHYIQHVGIGDNEADDPFHFAPSLIKTIIETAGQELGTHTYAHYYCNEQGQTIQAFQADIQAAKRVASTLDRQIRSLVFPRNQFNTQYLKVCYEEGIRIVRSNPLDWFWNIQSTQSESLWKRLNRGLDAYIPLGKQNTFPLSSLKREEGLPVCLPASRLLRPYRKKELVLNSMKISRIKNEMERAAQRGEIYHLWWHPHNFGYYTEKNLEGLKTILQHFDFCRDRYSMASLTMGEIESQIP